MGWGDFRSFQLFPSAYYEIEDEDTDLIIMLAFLKSYIEQTRLRFSQCFGIWNICGQTCYKISCHLLSGKCLWHQWKKKNIFASVLRFNMAKITRGDPNQPRLASWSSGWRRAIKYKSSSAKLPFSSRVKSVWGYI